MDDDDVVFLGKRHNLPEKFKISHRRRRIVREIDDQDFRPRKGLPIDTREVFKKIAVLTKFDSPNLSTGNDETIHVDWIGRSWGQHHITGTNQGQGQVGQAFL